MKWLKKWWWLQLVVILAIATVIGWKEKHCQTQAYQCRANYTAQLSARLSIDQRASAQQAIAAACEPNGYFCRLFSAANLPSMLLVFAGIGAIWAALLTLKSIHHQAVQVRKQNQYFVSKERARLSVNPDQEDSYRFSGVPFGQIAEIVVGIERHGPTKAFNVVGEMRVIIQPSKDPPVTGMFRMSELPDIVNGNAVTIQASTLFVGTITQDLLDKIDSEEEFVHLFGVITYTDVFDKSHWTRFRYIWVVSQLDVSPSGEEMPEIVIDRRWEKHGSPEDNKAI